MQELVEKQQLQTNEKSSDESANFERAMLLTGYGKYHIILLLTCGVISLAVGFQNGLSAYILSAAQCDLNLSSSEMGLLNSAFGIGGVLSAMLCGVVADAIGRRNIMIWCLLIDGSFTILSSLSQSFPVFFIFRLISGFVIGGPSTILVSFLGEFHAEKTRATAICYLGIYWTISWLLLPGLAWIIISLDFSLVVYGFVFKSWRLFVGIFGLPSLLGAYMLSRYPETPRFLLSQGEDKKALQIMREMFVSNTNKEAYEYPVTMLIPDYPTSSYEQNTLAGTLNKMWKQLCCLLRPPLRKYTILSSTIMFTNMFGYYGLSLWLPELFNRFESYYKSHPNQTITVCELAYLREENFENTDQLNITSYNNFTSQVISLIVSNITTSQSSVERMLETCDNSVDSQVFINAITIAFSCLLGNFVSVYLAGRIEQRILPITMMVVSGICGCLIYFLRSSMQNLIIACVFSSLISTANVVISTVIVDMFPTNMNSMAISATSLAGRIGSIVSNLLFGLLLEISCEVPIFLVGGLVIFGGLLGFLFPSSPITIMEDSVNTVSLKEKGILVEKEVDNLTSKC